MRKIITTAIFALAILILSNHPASAQHGYTIEKPVKFAAKKSSVVLKGRIASRLESHTYVLKAVAGKTLYVQLESKNSHMWFFDDGSGKCGKQMVQFDQDYKPEKNAWRGLRAEHRHDYANRLLGNRKINFKRKHQTGESKK